MDKPSPKSRSLWLGLMVTLCVGIAAGGGILYYRHATRYVIPELPVPDIQDQSREAAHVERIHGAAYVRQASADDERAEAVPKPLSGQAPAGWMAVGVGSQIRLGSLLQAEAKSGVELMTAGRWYMGLDGEGAVVFQDARRNAEGTEHLFSVFVQKGLFRAKAAGDNSKGYFLEIGTAAAKIRVYEGEFGMEVVPGGHGRMWLVSGRALAVWEDGRRKELALRGMENL